MVGEVNRADSEGLSSEQNRVNRNRISLKLNLTSFAVI